MTNEEASVEKRTKSQIVASWLKQESFWKDVTTRTVAGVIVAVIIYLLALALGYLQTPEGPQTFANVLGVFTAISLIPAEVMLILYSYSIRTEDRKLSRLLILPIIATPLAGVVIILNVMDLL